MERIRREQLCSAAAAVIARGGFDGATMLMIAEEAGVSTGMLNHYFSNRLHLLQETLVFVSARLHAQTSALIDGLPPGEKRLRAVIRSLMPRDPEMLEAWRVWTAAFGASVALDELREVMAARNELWFVIFERALEGVLPPHPERVPYARQLDALLNGLILQAGTTPGDVSLTDIEETIVAAAVEHGRVLAANAAED
jgi:TetR/AcrR family transcriptional regulator, transcriptional repressor of bet genes